MKTESEDHKSAPTRPQLASRPLGSQKILHGSFNNILGKEQINLTRPLTENNGFKPSFPFPPVDGAIKYTDSTEKENNPEMAERSLVPTKRTGRASICTMAARRIPMALAPRRNSLIPLPSIPSSTHLPSPLPTYQVDKIDEGDGSDDSSNCLTEQAQCDSPKEIKYGGKKLSNMLRRSLQKKMQMKSPMQQHMRRGGINLGMEKVRVSIGSRGRMAAHRVLLVGNGRRVAKETQSKKEKERGWNIGTAVGRTVI